MTASLLGRAKKKPRERVEKRVRKLQMVSTHARREGGDSGGVAYLHSRCATETGTLFRALALSQRFLFHSSGLMQIIRFKLQ